jgi:DNA-binding beta-propeller fold protein YncE
MKILARMGFVLAAAAMTTLPGISQGSAKPMLLVANQADRTLSLIDPVAGKQIAAIPVGGITGHEVAVSADAKTAYVPIYGDSGVGRPGTNGSAMAVIDLATRKVVRMVDFGRGVRPHMPLLDPASGMLYVTTEMDQAVTVIDPASLQIVAKVPTGQVQSHMLVVSRDGGRGYTANVGPGTVSVLDMAGRKLAKVIPVSGEVQRISMSRDGRMVFTADQTKPQIAVIDTATNTVKTWIPLPAVGYGSATTLDGRWLLVQMGTLKQVAIIDLHTMQVARTVGVGAGTGEILMRPDGKVGYVSCPVDGKVAEIDLSTWTVTRVIDAGKKADGLAWAK